MESSPRQTPEILGEEGRDSGRDDYGSSPGETMTQGDPAARAKARRIIMIPPHRLSDLNLVNYLLAKQQWGYLAQTHIATEKGKLVLGVRAYPKNAKSPALVAFIVLEATGEFAGQFSRKEKALQMQVYGMWNTPPGYQGITERLRRIIPGVIPTRHFVARSRRTEILDGERIDVRAYYARIRRMKEQSIDPHAA